MQGAPAETFAQTFEAASDVEGVDANLCVQCGPLYSSAEAAHVWLDAHPGSRVLPIKQAWDLSILRDWRHKDVGPGRRKVTVRYSGRSGPPPVPGITYRLGAMPCARA